VEPKSNRHIDNFFKIHCYLEVKGSTVDSEPMSNWIQLENTSCESLLWKLQKLIDKYEERHNEKVSYTNSIEADINTNSTLPQVMNELQSGIEMLDKINIEHSKQKDSGQYKSKLQVETLKTNSFSEQENINDEQVLEQIKIVDCQSVDKVAPKLIQHYKNGFRDNPTTNTNGIAEQNNKNIIKVFNEGQQCIPILPPKRLKSMIERPADQLQITNDGREANVKYERRISIKKTAVEGDKTDLPKLPPKKLRPINIDINVQALMPGARPNRERKLSNCNILPIPSRNEEHRQPPPLVRRK
jgi:hypothetical protein